MINENFKWRNALARRPQLTLSRGAGITVTEENKKEYVDFVVEYRISKRIEDQFDAFMSGFSELIPQDLINVFDERELELLISGISEINVYVFLSLFFDACRDLTFL
jgi:hypothetical protein